MPVQDTSATGGVCGIDEDVAYYGDSVWGWHGLGVVPSQIVWVWVNFNT